MAHTYILGQSGSGKSTLLKHHIINDMHSGYGVCFVDPHGSDTDELLQHVPRHRIKDTIVFDPTDDATILWNPLQEHSNVPLVATSLADTIKDAWGYHGVTTPVLDMYLYFTIATLIKMDRPFSDSIPLLTSQLVPEAYTDFWATFKDMTPKERRDATASTLNKLFILFGDERLANIFSTKRGKVSMSDIVKDKLLFVRLPQGQLGLSKVSLLGSIVLSQLHLAALRRDSTVPFNIYIDEVHHFSPTTIAEMLSGSRKFGVSVTVAHQYIDQLSRPLFASLMGNASTRHIFTVSPEDAVRLQRRFGTYGSHLDLDELDPFRYRTFPWHPLDSDQATEPLEGGSRTRAEKVRQYTRRNYCRGQ